MKLIVRWSAAGAAFGLLFVLLAWAIAANDVAGITFREAHEMMPVIWVVDLAPIVLLIVGAGIGVFHARLVQVNERAEELAQDIAGAWTSDFQRSNAELATTLEAQEQFLATVSHEFRTPLTSILGYAELAAEEEASPTLTAFISEIGDSAQFLLSMVNELLDVARMSRSGVTLNLQNVDANKELRSVTDLLRPLASSSKIGLRFDTAALGECRADPLRLRQIVTNLVANAVKYSDSGTVELRSRLAGGNFVIEVIDEGQGLAPEDLERVFAPFERVGAAERADSTGLGLTLSRAMANAMDGELSAWSAGPGKGSTFTLTLPMASDAAAETRQAQLTGTAA